MAGLGAAALGTLALLAAVGRASMGAVWSAVLVLLVLMDVVARRHRIAIVAENEYGTYLGGVHPEARRRVQRAFPPFDGSRVRHRGSSCDEASSLSASPTVSPEPPAMAAVPHTRAPVVTTPPASVPAERRAKRAMRHRRPCPRRPP